LILADHTFDEVHHSDRLHPKAQLTGAMYLETSTAKVSSMTVSLAKKAEAFSVRGSGPQGLRRPRFSFF
jgi:hypothetical protein